MDAKTLLYLSVSAAVIGVTLWDHCTGRESAVTCDCHCLSSPSPSPSTPVPDDVQGRTESRASAAESALRLAKESPNTDDALMYCMNALQKDGESMACYRYVAELSEQISDPHQREEIARVLELGLYQVQPQDMKELADLLAKLRSRMEAVSEPEPVEEEAAPDAASPDELLAELKKQILAEADADRCLRLCAERLELLRELSAEGGAYAEETEKTTAFAAFVSLNRSILGSLNRAEAEMQAAFSVGEHHFSKYDEALQCVDAQMAQLRVLSWNLAADFRPASLSATLTQAEEKLQHAIDFCSELQSQSVDRMMEAIWNKEPCTDAEVLALEQAEAARRSAAPKRGPLTVALDDRRLQYAKLELLNARLTDAKLKAKWAEKLAQERAALSDKQKERMKQYQIWAVGTCQKARAARAQHNAQCAIEWHMLRVDVSLLLPETAGIYQTLMSTYKSELEGDALNAIEEKLVKETKRTLEEE